MKKILIFGAGSIGNHMAYAANKIGLKIFITDINLKALLRMKEKIYPQRYKKWNSKIKLVLYKDVFSLTEKFDLIVLGTPPATHIDLYIICKKFLKFKKILIEKPLIPFNDNRVKIFNGADSKMIFCGYNHSISKSFIFFINEIYKIRNEIKEILVEWKEGWKGILQAHFWLKNEFQSYLGNYKLGGGATQEHSHGIHLLVCILTKLNFSDLKSSKKIIEFKILNKIKYDFISIFTINRKNLFIKYETDLLTYPATKKIVIHTKKSQYTWHHNFKKNYDSVLINTDHKKQPIVKLFHKDRSTEFEKELKHIISIRNKSEYNQSYLNLTYAIEVVKIMKQILTKNERKQNI
jgi:hypothetical protein